MKQKKYTTAQEIAKLKTVTTQLFMNIVQLQQEIKNINPDFKTLVEIEREFKENNETNQDGKDEKKD